MIKKFHIRRFKGINDICLDNLGDVNAFYGRNNSGKSTILHALDMAGLALVVRNWENFQLKLKIKDLFQETGPFETVIVYSDGSELIVRQQAGGLGPSFEPEPTEEQKFKTVYIIPDPGVGLLQRGHKTPRTIMQFVMDQRFSYVNGLEILFALKYYAEKRERGFRPEDYEGIIANVKHFFPEVEELISERTEDDIATLSYREYGRMLDVLYTGSGLKHFVDIFVKATLSQASVVLVDEPEMGLHPSLQRELLSYFYKLSQAKGIQFFLATHSPVFLTSPDKVRAFRVENRQGERSAFLISKELLHTIWGDLGLRPGDLLQNDLVILVEGQNDVIFFEHVIHNLYQEEFKDIAVGIVQYAGDAASGIIKGTINISNIVPGKTYRLWIRDRDARPSANPSSNSTKFFNALKRNNENCYILAKREIEFYIPESALVAAQQGDLDKEEAIKKILQGKQTKKFCDLASTHSCCVPHGSNLQKLLQEHLSKENLDPEIKKIVENTLIPWRDDILGNVNL
ncbi:MAG: ATP-dependent endonuclease [Candidatus Hodarchaeota archaeon]